MKKFIFLAGAIFSMTSCSFSFDGDGGSVVTNLTALPTPNIIGVENDIVSWYSVPNASSYIVRVNSYEKNVGTSLEMELGSVLDSKLEYNVPTNVSIAVKALGNSILYSDSNWSNEVTYTYTKESSTPSVPSTPNADSEKLSLAQQMKLGFGYNFITKPFFGSQHASSNSVLDLNKVLTSGDINSLPIKSLEQTTIYESSFHSFSQSYNSHISRGAGVGLGLEGILSANLEESFKSDKSIDYSKYVESGFLSCLVYAKHYQHELIDYGTNNNLSTMLSKSFLDVILRNDVEVSSYDDQDLAEYILHNYGTHVLMGVKTGGSLSYNYSYATNNLDISHSISMQLTSKASASATDPASKDSISATLSEDLASSLSTSLKDGSTKISNNLTILGGQTTDYCNDLSRFDEFNIGSWYGSMNDSNAISIGISDNGIIGIADLIRFHNPSLATAFDNLINDVATEKYNSLVGHFKPYSPSKGTHESNPIEISTKEELMNIELDKHYVLTNDIDLKDIKDWKPIGLTQKSTGGIYTEFTGTLNGMHNGKMHKISNLQSISPAPISSDVSLFGLFAKLGNGSKVKNLIFDNVAIDYNHTSEENNENYWMHVGVVAGYVDGGEIKNVLTGGYINIAGESYNNHAGHYNVGGIAGSVYNNSTIAYCHNNVSIIAHEYFIYVGGIVGRVQSTEMSYVIHCYNTGNLRAISVDLGWGFNDWFNDDPIINMGGLVGVVEKNSNITLRDCYSFANEVTWQYGQDVQIGCLIGYCDGKNISTILYNTYIQPNNVSLSATGKGNIGEKYETTATKLINKEYPFGVYCLIPFKEDKFNDADPLSQQFGAQCWIYNGTYLPMLWFENTMN